MSQTIISAIVAAAGSLVGVLARSTRRARLSAKIERYSRLVDTLESSKAGSGEQLRGLVDGLTQALVESETRALNRTFDVSNFVLMIAFLAAGGGLAFFGWTLHPLWLKVPLMIVGGVFALFGLIGGGTQMFKTVEAAVATQRQSDSEREQRAS